LFTAVRATRKPGGKEAIQEENDKLMSDGLPQLLSGAEFYERVVNHEKEQRRVADDKKTRREERE
jgi:hypothetical protein